MRFFWLCLCVVILVVLVGAEDLARRPLPQVVRAVLKLKRTMPPEQRKDPVIVAESNSLFHPMARWWIDGMKKLDPPIDKFVIVALDQDEYRRLKNLNQVVAWDPALNMNWSKTSFRSSKYNKIVNYKWQIVVDLLKHGHDLLLTDVDVYWRKNPMPVLRSLPYCHMYLSVDLLAIPVDLNSAATKKKEKPHRVYPPFPMEGFQNRINTGFCYLRSVQETINLAETVLTQPLKGMDDQFTFNRHFNKIWETHRTNSNVSHGPDNCAHYGNLTFHILRPDLFQNRPIHQKYHQYDGTYYTLHFNFLRNYRMKMDAMISEGFMNASYRALRG